MKFLERVLLWFVIVALLGFILGSHDRGGDAQRVYRNIFGWIRGIR